ncbi:MAG: proprotein convertase P-domain-containing protein [Bacteroidota bacterium]
MYHSILTHFSTALTVVLMLIFSHTGHAQDTPTEYPIGSADTIRTCEGFFTDSGGSQNNYTAGENHVTTICSDESTGSHIRIQMRTMVISVEDELCFYDGMDTNAPLLACGVELANELENGNFVVSASFPVAVQASVENRSGCVTVSFNSNVFARAGWYAEISCVPACQKIEAYIDSSTPAAMPADTGWIDICPGDRVTLTGRGVFPQELGGFYNQTDSSEYIWDMGDGNFRYGPTVAHTYRRSGGYIAQLTIVDQLGCTNSLFAYQRVRVATKPDFTNVAEDDDLFCTGDTITLRGGIERSDANISVKATQGAFSAKKVLSDTLALPDGTGVPYQSGLTFTNFNPGQTLQDINDLVSVCVNIEHSYLRDLQIELICPNGQSTVLHEYAGQGGGGGTVHLGEPNDEPNSDVIIPGLGYDYCWTPAAGNATWIQTIRNFPDRLLTINDRNTLAPGDYATFEPLEQLIGCPLNGEWSIKVEDLWRSDNGVIFAWEIGFAPDLYPQLETFTPTLVDFAWEEDNSIIEQTPESITAVFDKSGEAAYTFNVTDNFGCNWDTTVQAQVLPVTHPDCYTCQDFSLAMRDTTLCSGEAVELRAGPAFTEDVVAFETSPRYDGLGFPNHPIGQEYSSTIEVTDVYPGTLNDPFSDIVSVCVDIETGDTDWVSDLVLSLVGPDGNFIILSANNGGEGSNYTQTCFTPNAVTPITAGTAPFTGDFQPQESWADLTGESMNGKWMLQVSDQSGPQIGTFNSWSITFNSRNPIAYVWLPSEGLSCDNCANPTAQPDGVQVYRAQMTDPFGCSYENQVRVGSVQDFRAPTVDCAVTDLEERTVTFSWTEENDTAIPYEIRINGGEWISPNNGDYSHAISGLQVNELVEIEIRPFIEGIPDNCDIEIASGACTYDLCSFRVNQPADPTPVSCFNTTDGTFSYELENGTAPFDFMLDGASINVGGNTSGLIQNISAGLHQLIVTDADACADTVDFNIDAPAAIEIMATIQEVRCTGGDDGQIALELSGGVGTLNATWNDGNNDIVYSDLVAGDYFLQVRDDNGCQLDTSFVIGEPDSILLDLMVNNVRCSGDTDGKIIATASGGTGELSFSWSNGAQNNQLSNLPEGNYSLTVTDENGCMMIEQAVIESPNPLTTTGTSMTPVDCKDNSTGTAIVFVDGGTLPYSFLWDDDLGQNSDTAILLAAGTYRVQVEDANGCSANTEVTVTEPDSLNIAFDLSPVNCFSGTDGVATALVTGGTSPYQYVWSDDSTQITQTASNLAPGDYTLSITDGNGCQLTAATTIEQPEAPITATLEQSYISCFGENDSELSIFAEGGTGDTYTYLWSNGQTDDIATSLSTEVYQVTVTDENGCEAVFESDPVVEYPEYSININFSVPTCNGFADGQAGASVRTGGSGSNDDDYLFEWNTGQTGNFINEIQGGRTYTVTVTDDQGCVGVESRPLPQPDPIVIELTSEPVLCHGDNSGSVSVQSINGGNLGYQLEWSANAGSATTLEVTDLPVGTYQVTVQDTLGCVGFANIDITQPEPLAATFQVRDNSCFNGADGQLTATVSGGIPTYELLWSTDARTSTIEKLTSGTYTLTVTDANACELITPVNVGQPVQIELTLTPGEIDCAGGRDGEFMVEAVGGTAPYRYSLDDKNFTSNSTFLGLMAGEYEVFVRDNNNCLQRGTTFLEDPEPFEVFIFPEVDFIEVEEGNELQLFANAENNTGVVDYVWTPSYVDSSLTCTECFNPTVNPKATIYYELYGIDELGCEATDRIQVRIAKFRTMIVPTGFTPDGDLLNDQLRTHGTAGTQVLHFRVFDRWGELVYEATDFGVNDETMGWNGNFRGQPMPAGVYVWVAEVEYEDGLTEVFKGSTQLLR